MLSSRWLRTTTGVAAIVYGEVDTVIKIGATKFNHHNLIENIAENVILGMDITNAQGLRLDLK